MAKILVGQSFTKFTNTVDFLTTLCECPSLLSYSEDIHPYSDSCTNTVDLKAVNLHEVPPTI